MIPKQLFPFRFRDLLLGLLVGCVVGNLPAEHATAPPTLTTRFENGWLFQRGQDETARFPETQDKHWRKVTLPHDRDLSALGPGASSQASGHLPDWYRKHFSLPVEYKGQQVYLRFVGDTSHSRVWLNGHDLGLATPTADGAEYNITRRFRFGNGSDNVLAIRHSPPGATVDSFPGDGPSRSVWLKIRNPIHLLTDHVTISRSSSPTASLKVRTVLVNHRETDATVTLEHVLYSTAGQRIGLASQPVHIGAGTSTDQNHRLKIPPLDSGQIPERIRITVLEAGQVIDQFETNYPTGPAASASLTAH